MGCGKRFALVVHPFAPHYLYTPWSLSNTQIVVSLRYHHTYCTLYHCIDACYWSLWDGTMLPYPQTSTSTGQGMLLACYHGVSGYTLARCLK